MKENKLYIPISGGNFVLHDYDTERDMLKAKRDIERMLCVLAQGSLYEAMTFLAPYRLKCAKGMQAEYDELAKN